MVIRLRSCRVNCLKLRVGSFNSNGFYIFGLVFILRKFIYLDMMVSDNSGMMIWKIMNGKMVVFLDIFK